MKLVSMMMDRFMEAGAALMGRHVVRHFDERPVEFRVEIDSIEYSGGRTLVTGRFVPDWPDHPEAKK